MPPASLAAWRARTSHDLRDSRDSNSSDSSELSNARTMERASNSSELLDDDFEELAHPHRKGRASGDLELPLPKEAHAKDAAAKEMAKGAPPHAVHAASRVC